MTRTLKSKHSKFKAEPVALLAEPVALLIRGCRCCGLVPPEAYGVYVNCPSCGKADWAYAVPLWAARVRVGSRVVEGTRAQIIAELRAMGLAVQDAPPFGGR